MSDDQDIRSALRRADGPRRPTAAEAERILAVLEARGPHGRPDAEVIDLRGRELPPRTRRPRGRIALVAAALLAVIGIAAVANRGSGPAETASTPPASVCAEELPALIAGLDAWRTIDAWAAVGDAEPDLAVLLAETLDALPDSDTADLAERVRSLPAGQAAIGRSILERSTVANEALTTIIASLERYDGPSCDLTSLRAAVDS